jgi:hypothetical protein
LKINLIFLFFHLDKEKLGTITGISNLQEWTWPTDDDKVGYIHARALPGIGE